MGNRRRNASLITPAEGATDADRDPLPLDKIRDRRAKISHLQIAATTQFASDVFGNIFRPAFGGIEGDDADRVAILADQQVLNYRL
jgi:hypothetical protein